MNELLMMVGADLADDVGRCAAAAGYRVLAGGPADAEWLRADAVVVDAEALDRLAAAPPARRSAVFLVCAVDAPPRVWQTAMAVGVGEGFALPADEEGLVTALTEVRAPARTDGRVLAIVGGHGGAGATTLAAATGLVAAGHWFGRGVLLISPDAVGTGVDLMLGIEDADGPRARDLNAAGGRIGHDALHDALPHLRGVTVLAAGGG
ncbi:MAG: hypothetical protein QM634_03650, partial [Gordonia sp. (in: high G+C Gram-positive bacteria)]